jgi:hypothetical protein
MGSALAGALLANGHRTTVWNRTAAKADALVAQGAVRAQTVAEAAGASPLVIACVIDYDAARAILDGAVDALQSRAVVNLTADSPERARAIAAWADEHDIDYLDGAIMTPTETIGGPAAVVLYSGPQAVFDRHQSAAARSLTWPRGTSIAPPSSIASRTRPGSSHSASSSNSHDHRALRVRTAACSGSSTTAPQTPHGPPSSACRTAGREHS